MDLQALALRRADEQLARAATALPEDGRDSWRIGKARRKPGPKPGRPRGGRLHRWQVLEIRRVAATSRFKGQQARLARRFGVSEAAVSRIVAGTLYRDIR
jgi:hypothetical protein